MESAQSDAIVVVRGTIEGIQTKLSDAAAARRMAVLEWIIVLLIAIPFVLPFL